MESESIAKSSEMPAVGALLPAKFSSKGYWWWKAQEISYALRPTTLTIKALEERLMRHNRTGKPTAVFQIRRTDKTEGCSKIYGIVIYSYLLTQQSSFCTGKHSSIKCKREAKSPRLIHYIEKLQLMMQYLGRNSGSNDIEIITDDVNIQAEIDQTAMDNINFLEPQPAPRRIPDKVASF